MADVLVYRGWGPSGVGVFGHVLGSSYTYQISAVQPNWVNISNAFSPVAGGFVFRGTDTNGTIDGLVFSDGTIVDLLVQNSVATTGNVIGLEAWDVVATGDYNGDGTADIALTSNGVVVNWTMQNGLVAAGNVLGGNGAFGVVA